MQQNMYRYFFSCLLVGFLLPEPALSQQQADSLGPATEMKAVPVASMHQLRIGTDISKIATNFMLSSRQSYEVVLDYYYRKELYFSLEGGWGTSEIRYPELWYTTRNIFVRGGVDKNMIPRLFPGDYDMLFIGFRYGVASIERGEAGYHTDDGFWGGTTGSIAGKQLTAHWMELTGGIRVELWKGLFAGYNVRAKFLINPKSFRELPPAFIAGYGKGEKVTAFDFNFYLQYAIRWRRSPCPE